MSLASEIFTVSSVTEVSTMSTVTKSNEIFTVSSATEVSTVSTVSTATEDV